jgi:hypothetical protein
VSGIAKGTQQARSYDSRRMSGIHSSAEYAMGNPTISVGLK